MSDRHDSDDLREIDSGLAETVEALHALPSEATPPRDLWPEIQARIAAERRPMQLGVTSQKQAWWKRSVSIPWALAASLVLASAIGLGTWRFAQFGANPQVASGTAAGPSTVVQTVSDDLSLPDYDLAVSGLRDAYEAGKERLAPETVEVLEQSLQAIDDAIAEARAAIQADPARDEVRRILYHNMNRKLDVLRQAASAVQDRA